MTLWPALDIRQDAPDAIAPPRADLVLAALDDFEPMAVEEHATGFRVFFRTSERRDAAQVSLASNALADTLGIRAIDVPDEDWARRSQRDLEPVHVGRITIFPSLESRIAHAGDRPVLSEPGASPDTDLISLVIPPSMGFGTGHHATTRLCLQAMQTVDLRGVSVLDLGTGSGILAIAANRLGSSRVLGIDIDPHALVAARETRALNLGAGDVAFESGDLADLRVSPFDVVIANLTGALLARAAGSLSAAVKRGGTFIVSGLLAEELANVRAAFPDRQIVWQQEEDGWAALVMKSV